MKIAKVHSVCECQARLYAELDEKRCAVRGLARNLRRNEELLAPATSIGPERERFDVGWLCPYCTRNVLRSFTASALSYSDVLPKAG